MGDIEINISLPLDDEGFFRRECPFCRREFKVMLTKDELGTLAQEGIDSFMTEAEEKADSGDDSQEEVEYFCFIPPHFKRDCDYQTGKQGFVCFQVALLRVVLLSS